jgi:hypothetical protein
MCRSRWIGVAAAVLVVLNLVVVAGAGAAQRPTVIHAQEFGISPPVAELGTGASSDAGSAPARVDPLAGQHDAAARATRHRSSVSPDPLIDRARAADSRTPAPGTVFEGGGNTCGCTPPDTTGDVGPNNYVQLVNSTKVAIYNKNGSLAKPAFELSTLFPPGSCNPNNDGDPQVVYDPIADRWVLAQFHDLSPTPDSGPFFLCFAVSQTPDPTGAYFTYAFPTPDFPDYFKVGVWPSGYYVSSNESTYTAYAFDRAKMLAGDPTASGIRFPGESNMLLPADVDGVRFPAGSEGGLFYTFKDGAFHGGSDRIDLDQLTPNFGNPSASSFSTIATLPVTPFTYTVCGFFNLACIPQSGSAQNVDAVSEWPMQRFAYRRFGDHEALVGNFTVGGGSATPGAAIRWFELRNTGGNWSLFQEGTFDPGGGLNRFMGSISMDVEGNIALGYSASSSAAFPSIRYATRAPSDPAGTMGAEQVMQAGSGSQTSAAHRWGDYSAMSVDPVDDCTFWYTNEFYPATAVGAWHTAIGNFKVPSCADTDKDGIANASDACPSVADLSTANGCPSNQFNIGKKKANKKKGTATISVTVPGPGKLKLAGKGLKGQSPGNVSNKAKLKVIPTGKTKKKLNQKGKAKVKAKITFTPTGGLPATQATNVKLKKS